MYYANYLKFMERARTEWLRSLGFEQDRLMHTPGVIFAVRSVKLDYLKPARFNERLAATLALARRGSASMSFEQEIRRGDEVLCRGEVRVACLDAASFAPVPIPGMMLEKLDEEAV